MLAVMNELTDKPEWDKKVFNDEIVGKWKAEALGKEGVDFSVKMFDYCIQELRDKASFFSKTGRVSILDTEAAIVKSDSAIPPSLQAALKAAVQPLENVPDRQKDWHPGSNEKVLDLVHPSLYPLMYGKSLVLPHGRVNLQDCIQSCGQGVVVPKPDREELHLPESFRSYLRNDHPRGGSYGAPKETALDYWSDRHQWLPCEVAFRGSDEVEITSYVNNLHPVHNKELYGILEKIIARTILLWNDNLSSIGTGLPLRIEMKSTNYEGHTPGYPMSKEQRKHRILVRPEPHDYHPINPEHLTRVDLRRDWGKEGIQVIIKLANIELRPEDGKTEYEGGTWHVEGQLNEHICASAIYYYSQDNVTDSRLAFRQLTDGNELGYKAYGQWDYEGVEELYGVKQGGPCVQEMGDVLTREGRILAFPNVLQHRVRPFKLIDPTKPGHRKILAMFLVDPYIRVLSTANVPPQQRDWWAEAISQDFTRLGKLPAELMETVMDRVDNREWPISIEEAKEVRKDLMQERSAFVDKVNVDYEQEGFSFCEH
ncbi:hypothetical protein E1B28_008334 [Marasmius oreades]|nr:uncharacterized protein E1B28_008334 [Marasmius oreades]KAG7091943.1 hypothetical protein E1B28_008334 [Marasmius oreades]